MSSNPELEVSAVETPTDSSILSIDRFVVRSGETEKVYDAREPALKYARQLSKEVRGPVVVENEREHSQYRYVGGELAQFVAETRR